MDLPSTIPSVELPSLGDVFGKLALKQTFRTLDALRTVKQSIYIGNSGGTERTNKTLMNVSLSLLETTGNFLMNGTFSSISSPQLRSTFDSKAIEGARLRQEHNGPPLAVELPKREAVYGSIDILGNISSLSLPRLRHITSDLHIDTTEELAVSLPLEHARAIQLRGKIKSAEFPNLKNWLSTIEVDSDVAFYCDEFLARLTAAHGDHPAGKIDCHSPTSSADYDANEGAMFPKGDGVLFTGAAVVAALLGFLFYLFPI